MLRRAALRLPPRRPAPAPPPPPPRSRSHAASLQAAAAAPRCSRPPPAPPRAGPAVAGPPAAELVALQQIEEGHQTDSATLLPTRLGPLPFWGAPGSATRAQGKGAAHRPAPGSRGTALGPRGCARSSTLRGPAASRRSRPRSRASGRRGPRCGRRRPWRPPSCRGGWPGEGQRVTKGLSPAARGHGACSPNGSGPRRRSCTHPARMAKRRWCSLTRFTRCLQEGYSRQLQGG